MFLSQPVYCSPIDSLKSMERSKSFRFVRGENIDIDDSFVLHSTALRLMRKRTKPVLCRGEKMDYESFKQRVSDVMLN